MTLRIFFWYGIRMEQDVHQEDTREYEIAVIMTNDADEPIFSSAIQVIQKDGPKAVVLGYAIKKHTSGFLRIYIVRCVPAVAHELNGSLQSNKAVIRHLLITPPTITRRRDIPMREQSPGKQEGEKIETMASPARSEAISNEALEQALGKILENNES